MSDPKSSYGEPVEEPTTVDDDVVVRAEEGLADAEAAKRDAVSDEPAAVAVDAPEPAPAPTVDHVDDEPEYTTAADYAAAYGHDDDETVVAAPVVTPSEPA